MQFDPLCLINYFMAVLALALYVVGSYRLYRYKSSYLIILGIAIAVDILTAILASLSITPTVQIENTVTVPWHSVLFKFHVVFSMIGFVGFIALFVYLVIQRKSGCHPLIRKWQFLVLLPIWIIGESIALLNATMKLTSGMRLFDMI
jgi:hypothetical protein